MQKTYHIKTFGCQMNVRDSESAAGILQSLGYTYQADIEKADIVLYNTCCIRDLAEKKAESAIGASKHYKAKDSSCIIGVFGCMVQQEGVPEDLSNRFPHLDFCFGTNSLHLLPELIQNAKDNKKIFNNDYYDVQKDFDLPAYRNKPPLAYTNIMFGCNNFCSYCIVPFVRGKESSKPAQLVIDEVKTLIEQGYKQVTLLGQNVNSYGKDIGYSFSKLLRDLDKTGIERIRFMTSHPKDLSDDLIETMADCSSVCKQVHLPIQSGSDAVLRNMNRKYTTMHYSNLVDKLRAKMPDIGLSTDIMVGFPGETDNDFNDTLQLLQKIEYDAVYTFAFSKRKGTKAYGMPNQIDKKIKSKRLEKLIGLQREITAKINKQFIGKTLPVLVEGVSKRGDNQLIGTIDRGITVNFSGSEDLVGKIIDVDIIKAHRNSLAGRVE